MTLWTIGEKNLIVTAACAAPSVHNTQPWVLELHEEGSAELYERLDRALPRHDPLGRDRLISCGAALQHVVLAMRVLGWTPEVTLFPDTDRPDLVARVTTAVRTEPSEADIAAYDAIPHRRSNRTRFRDAPVDATLRTRLLAANRTDGVGVRVVASAEEITALAKVVSHSALVLRADRGYQRELSAWMAPVREPLPGGGVSAATRRTSTLPWAGLVRATTAVPDTAALADRLGDELLVLVETSDDGPHDHVRAGMAAESVWLAATAAGLAGSLLTQPFQPSESRAGLVEALFLSGFPQLLLRLGHGNHHEER
jgi:hypothetical protein